MIEPIARVRIELREIEPTLWRRVDVPLTSTLLALHDIIQVTVGWTDSHLFEFVVGERVYSEPLPDDELFERKVYNAAGIRLRTANIIENVRDGAPDDERRPARGCRSGFMRFLEPALYTTSGDLVWEALRPRRRALRWRSPPSPTAGVAP